jgi:hypothetical protein
MHLQAYLDTHYQTLEQLADTCGITANALGYLVSQQLIPEPSYTVISDDKCLSQAFGELSAKQLRLGRYFHPSNKVWVAIAIDTKNKMSAKQASDHLKERFTQNFAAELKVLDTKTFRLQDSFTDSGDIIPDGLHARTDSAWTYFLKGVFSLCVADPSSEKSIATKEVLQEALIFLTDNGLKTNFSQAEKHHVLNLVDQYEQAAMPFSSIEYPISSRKRLVEDLRAKLNDDQ